MREYVQNLVDIETCNIFALKSMAKSVDAEHLTDFISNDYPERLLKLINLFSVNKSYIFEQFKLLNQEANAPLVGSIDIRNQVIDPNEYYKELIFSICKNISDIEGLILKNKIPYLKNFNDLAQANNSEYSLRGILTKMNTDSDPEYLINQLFKRTIKNSLNENEEITDDTHIHFYDEDGNKTYVKFKDLANILNLQIIIKNITIYNDLLSYDSKLNTKDFLSYFTKVHAFFKNEDKIWINPFHILIFIFKGLLWNPYINTFFNTTYENREQNTLIQCSDFYYKIIETIQTYDENYINNFIVFHFYGLFYDMLINDDLKNEWNWNNKIPYFISTAGDYSKEHFKSILQNYISNDEIDIIFNNITNYKQIHVDFIHYLTILNSFLEYDTDEIEDKENVQFKITKNTGNVSYFIFNRFNNPLSILDPFNEEKRRLLGYNADGSYNEKNDKILKLAKEFSDLCIQISYARENIKTIIQQYSFIGTQKIISDIVRDYFIKNYSKRGDWRLISDRNRELDKALLSIDTLNRNYT